jgi:hypothetical protein
MGRHVERHDLFIGMKLVCIDDTGLHGILRIGQSYQVKEVSHRGALIRVWGVPMLVASNRFTPAGTSQGANSEGVNASA